MDPKLSGIGVLCITLLVGCGSGVEAPPAFTAAMTSTDPLAQQPSGEPIELEVDTPAGTIGIRSFVDVYKTIDDTQLEVHVYLPPEHAESDARPVFIFFHGGGWYSGEPENGARLCEHWAERGLVAIAFEYRLADFDRLTPVECVTDAKSAVRWVRTRAAELGIDPSKIIVTGGSAGGHLALSTAMVEGFEEEFEDLSIPSTPDAVVAWSAAVNVSEDRWFAQLLGDRTGVSALSPAQQVRADLPPTLLLHGTADETVPYWTVEQFVEDMRRAGNRCELQSYEGGGHLFHIDQRTQVLGVIEEFLMSIGIIQ